MNTHTASFRDPAGFVCELNHRILRFVHHHEVSHLNGLLASPLINQLIQQKKIVSTTPLSQKEMLSLLSSVGFTNGANTQSIGAVVEHKKISFPSYPYEWAPEMLHAAALLTLDLAEQLLQEGKGLKDATPYNVLFDGPHGIFVDFLSFENRHACDPIWLPYAQFIRMFLFPLLAHHAFGTPLSQLFLSRRDGLEAEELHRMAHGLNRLKPLFLSLVTVPVMLSKWANGNKKESSIYIQRLMKSPEKAQFVLQMSLKRLKKQLRTVQPDKTKRSRWTSYMVEEKSYSDDQFIHKQAFVSTLLKQQCPKHVLDIGCNMGIFSCIAAEQGAKVVAIDIDPAVVGRLWTTAQEKKLDILPLVVDIGRPTPAVGWNNKEQLSFLERARGHFDMVMMLAVLHHLLVQERIPMEEIAALAAQLTTKGLIIEYIAPQDPLFRRIARGRDSLYTHLTQQYFEQAFSSHFVIRKQEPIKGEFRTLYWMEKHPNPA